MVNTYTERVIVGKFNQFAMVETTGLNKVKSVKVNNNVSHVIRQQILEQHHCD
jgi:hypothetical protein